MVVLSPKSWMEAARVFTRVVSKLEFPLIGVCISPSCAYGDILGVMELIILLPGTCIGGFGNYWHPDERQNLYSEKRLT